MAIFCLKGEGGIQVWQKVTLSYDKALNFSACSTFCKNYHVQNGSEDTALKTTNTERETLLGQYREKKQNGRNSAVDVQCLNLDPVFLQPQQILLVQFNFFYPLSIKSASCSVHTGKNVLGHSGMVKEGEMRQPYLRAACGMKGSVSESMCSPANAYGWES